MAYEHRALNDGDVLFSEDYNRIGDALHEATAGLEELREVVKDAAIADIKALLTQVRDALQNGDIDEAIRLLDTFVLDEGVLE